MENEAKITNVVKRENNVQIRIDSRYESRSYYTNQKSSITMIGFFVTLVLGLIGVSNMLNTLITDTLARKNEILILQSVGMTKKQLWNFLFRNNLKLCSVSAGICLFAGSYITMIVASDSMFTGFNTKLFGVDFIILIIFMAILCAVLASVMTLHLNRKSLLLVLPDWNELVDDNQRRTYRSSGF